MIFSGLIVLVLKYAEIVWAIILGIIEVFVDTVALCGITVLAILLSDSGWTVYGDDAVTCAGACFTSVLGNGAGYIFAVCIWMFASATVFCWAHYGRTCVDFIVGTLLPNGTDGIKKKRLVGVLYAVAIFASFIFGSVAALNVFWIAADTAIGLMTLSNLTLLVMARKEIKAETDSFMHTVLQKHTCL